MKYPVYGQAFDWRYIKLYQVDEREDVREIFCPRGAFALDLAADDDQVPHVSRITIVLPTGRAAWDGLAQTIWCRLAPQDLPNLTQLADVDCPELPWFSHSIRYGKDLYRDPVKTSPGREPTLLARMGEPLRRGSTVEIPFRGRRGDVSVPGRFQLAIEPEAFKIAIDACVRLIKDPDYALAWLKVRLRGEAMRA